MTLAGMLLSPQALALSIGLSGSGSSNNGGLEHSTTSSGTLSISTELGSYLRIGISTRKAFEKVRGLKYDDSSNSYFNFRADRETTIHSLNMTVILYNGIVSPYVFGGIANKYYESKATYDLAQSITVTSKSTLKGVPTYGFGAAIFLNRQFNLKISQTYIPGEKTTLGPTGEEEAEDVIDHYTQIGITYKL